MHSPFNENKQLWITNCVTGVTGSNQKSFHWRRLGGRYGDFLVPISKACGGKVILNPLLDQQILGSLFEF